MMTWLGRRPNNTTWVIHLPIVLVRLDLIAWSFALTIVADRGIVRGGAIVLDRFIAFSWIAIADQEFVVLDVLVQLMYQISNLVLQPRNCLL